MSKTNRATERDIAELDERFSGLTDMEVTLLDEALASVDASKFGLDQYQVFIDLRTAIEIQLNDRNCDLEDIIAYATGPVQH